MIFIRVKRYSFGCTVFCFPVYSKSPTAVKVGIPAHAMLDGQRVEVDKPFEVNGYKIMFPGDTSAPGYLVYNWRCRIVAAFDDMPKGKRRAEDPVTGKSEIIPDMSYQEWAAKKRAKNAEVWDTYMKKGRNRSADTRQWNEYKSVLGNKIPNTIDKFQNLKYTEPEKWELMKLDKRRRDTLIEHPELALPGEKKTIATEKFTGYLFNPDNPEGWAKSKALSSRLGYTIDNYESLLSEILAGAKRYPAVSRGDNGHGILYEQKMVLYGKTENPANVIVGWLYKDGKVHMTTVYITEV